MWYHAARRDQEISQVATKRLAVVLLIGLYLSACTNTPPLLPPVFESGSNADASSDPAQDVPVAPADEVEAATTQTATLALLNQSARAQNSGDHVQAVAYVERAIRLNPRQADLWLRLAELHLAQQAPEAAIQYANKSISLAGERMDWVRDAWLLIADACEAQGDQAAADEIRRKWRTYRG